jgi:hypothetical protein
MAVDHVLDNDEDLMKSLLEEAWSKVGSANAGVFGDPAPLAGMHSGPLRCELVRAARSCRAYALIELGS